VKKFLGIIFLTGMMTTLHAQAAVVFDPTNYLVAIDQLYSAYDQVMNTIQQIQYQYEMIQHYYKQAQSWKLDELTWDGDWDFRNEIRDVTSSVNRQITNIRSVEHYLTDYPIRLGGQSYSMRDLVGAGAEGKDLESAVKNTGSWIMSDVLEKAAAGFAGKLTERERAAIWNKYGLSPKNYYYLESKKRQMDTVIATIKGYAMEEALRKNIADMEERMAAIMDKSFGDDVTEKQLLQNEMWMQRELIRGITELQTLFKKNAELTAWKVQIDEDRAAMEKEEAAYLRQVRIKNNYPGSLF
jgi:hypothetical protein